MRAAGGNKVQVRLLPAKASLRPAADVETQAWETAMSMVNTVLSVTFDVNATSRSFSFEEVRASVRCLSDLGIEKRLVEALSAALEQCASERVVRFVEQRADREPLQTLRYLVSQWGGFDASVREIAGVFYDVDKRYMTTTADLSIRRLGLRLLCARVRAHPWLLPQALAGFLQRIDEDRNGFACDSAELSRFRDIALECGTYALELEPAVLDSTAAFYRRAVERLVLEERCSAPELFRRVSRWLSAERQRALTLLHGSRSRDRLEEVLQPALLEPHGPAVLSANFAALASDPEHFADVALAWRLLSLRYVNKGLFVRNTFREFVVAAGTRVVSGQPLAGTVSPMPQQQPPAQQQQPQASLATRDGDEGVIRGVIGLKRAVDALVRGAFDNSDAFVLVMREAFETFMRARQARVAELLSRHVDGCLRDVSSAVAVPAAAAAADGDAGVGGAGGADERASAVEEAMNIFAFLPAKDLFEAFHWRDFARRLIFQRSASIDAERLVIRRLKEISGSQTAMKMEGMLKDLDLSKELSLAFSAATQRNADDENEAPMSPVSPSSPSAEALDGGTVETKISVLTNGYWPPYPQLPLQLAPPLHRRVQAFAAFYARQHTNRRLSWLHALATCTLRAVFPRGGRKELTCSTLQALLLLQFNNGCDEHSVQSLRQAVVPALAAAVGQPPSAAFSDDDRKAAATEFQCALLALTGGTQRLLKRPASNPSGATLNDSDVLTFNADFTHRLVKIRINQVLLRDTAAGAAEAQQTAERAFEERKHVVDAAIVRCMKSRRVLPHAELLAEVARMLVFPAAAADIKKRVEYLIDREYLRRTGEDGSTYEYVA